MRYYILVVFIACSCNVNCKPPDFIKICKRNDPDLNNCIMRSVKFLQPKLATGIPALNVPGLEPFEFPELKLGKSSMATLTNVKATGASTFELQEVKVNLKNLKFGFKIHIPTIEVTAKYDLDVKLMTSIPLKGSGPMNATLSDFDIAAVINGEIYTKENVKYIRFTGMKVDASLGNSRIYLDNLFNGDKVLGEATNSLVNENNGFIMNSIGPAIENVLVKKFTDMANSIVMTMTYDELFPE